MITRFRRAFAFIALSSVALVFAGCSKGVVGNTYKSGNGQLSVEFSTDSKADVKVKAQAVDDVEYTRTGDTITVKTRVFGDMIFKVLPDGNLQTGNPPITLVKKL